MSSIQLHQLQGARALDLPSREAMLHREPSVQHFWDSNRNLLTNAWKEWEESEKESLFPIDSSLLDSKLRDAITLAWEDPSKESAVKDLWEEVTPDVFQCQFFNPERLADLRGYMEKVWDAQIPIRPPHGILLNRGGAMLDKRSEGYIAAPSFQAFYSELINTYMRPIARLLFPEVIGYDTQSFGFAINYQPNTEASIRPHTDASAVTLNINLNLPGEEFTGSALDFYDRITGQKDELSFKSGTAVIHRGNVAHAAKPITSGERTNIVLWLYGDHGRMPPQISPQITLQTTQDNAINARERWTVPSGASDNYAPF